jgi:hypothetical protein
MRAQVVIPGRVMIRACLGGDDHIPAAVPGIQERRAARLTGPGSAGMQQQHRHAHNARHRWAKQASRQWLTVESQTGASLTYP